MVKIVDEDLNENFGDYVNIDKAVERLAEKLKKEQEELELKLSNINKAKEPFTKIRDGFFRLDKIDIEKTYNEKETFRIKNLLSSSNKNKVNFKNKIVALEKEAKNSENVGTFTRWFSGRRSYEDIQGDIRKLKIN